MDLLSHVLHANEQRLSDVKQHRSWRMELWVTMTECETKMSKGLLCRQQLSAARRLQEISFYLLMGRRSPVLVCLGPAGV